MFSLSYCFMMRCVTWKEWPSRWDSALHGGWAHLDLTLMPAGFVCLGDSLCCEVPPHHLILLERAPPLKAHRKQLPGCCILLRSASQKSPGQKTTMPFPALSMLKLFPPTTESSPRDSIPPVAVPSIEGSNSSVLEITQLLLGQLESAERWLSADSRGGSRFSGGRSARVSSVCRKEGTEGSERWNDAQVSVKAPHVAAKPHSEGQLPADSHHFFKKMNLLCWHHNTNGGRERAREKMNVLVSA